MKEQTAAKIRSERARQGEKWGGGQFVHMTQERIFCVLAEEVGEVAKAILEWKKDIDGERRIEEEIIHVAAVAARWLDECFSDVLR